MPLVQCGAGATNIASEAEWCQCSCGGCLKIPRLPALPAAEPAAAAAGPVAVVGDEADASAGYLVQDDDGSEESAAAAAAVAPPPVVADAQHPC